MILIVALIYIVIGLLVGFWYRREMAEHMHARAIAIPDKLQRNQALAGLSATITIGIALMMFLWPVFLSKRLYRKLRTRN